MDGQTIAYKVLGKTGVLVHANQLPNPTEWNKFITLVRADVIGKKVKGLVVFSIGGAPTDNQRELLTGLMRFHNLPTAVIIDDSAQFVDAGGCTVQGLNWTGNLKEQTWSPAQQKEAIATVTQKDTSLVQEALTTLQIDLGIVAA